MYYTGQTNTSHVVYVIIKMCRAAMYVVPRSLNLVGLSINDTIWHRRILQKEWFYQMYFEKKRVALSCRTHYESKPLFQYS